MAVRVNQMGSLLRGRLGGNELSELRVLGAQRPVAAHVHKGHGGFSGWG